MIDGILKKAELRDAILRYFLTARESYGISRQPEFSKYDYGEVKQALYAADRLGLIAKISGNGSASKYQTTDDGSIVLERMMQYEFREPAMAQDGLYLQPTMPDRLIEQIVERVLARLSVQPPARITPLTEFDRSPKLSKVLEFLNADPERAKLPLGALEITLGISASYICRARKQWRWARKRKVDAEKTS